MRHYSNVSKTMSLQVGMDLDDLTVTVDDASGLPAQFPYNIAVDYGAASVEVMSVTAAASNVLTVVRGQEDTAAANHSVGAVVVHAATALDFQDAAVHVAATADVHGIGGASSVVGTATAQTLTNKTMSGGSNTFSNIPRTTLTGSENNLTVGQSNAASPALTVTPNGAPATDVISNPYWKLDQNGITRFIGKTAAADVTRWYATDGTTLRAKIDETGRGTFIGVTTTGSITATGQSLAIGSVTASGLITANGGVTIPAGQTLTVDGTLTASAAAVVTFNSDVSFSNNKIVSLTGTGTLFVSLAAQIDMTGAIQVHGSGSVVTIQSTGTLNVDGTLNRDATTARMLMAASETFLTASTNPTGAANSYNDLTGCTFTFTVPGGRTAVVDVSGLLNILGSLSTTASFELVAVLDGVIHTVNPIVTTTTNVNYTIAKRWIYTGVAAGAHTIKLQYRNVNGNGTVTLLGGDDRTSQSVMVYW